jgi:glycine/D-amino acid oxidase-like deaminating enzyme
MTGPEHRTETGAVVDLLVVGGGVNGAGIARDAVGRGLSVLLCEKGDLAEGTSSRSGKLVHGGLRYLEYYEFRLVREALIEREVLLAAAPHIIWPMRFVLPHDSFLRPAWLLRTGLFLYDHLGGRKRLPASRGLDLHRAPEGKPLQDRFRRGFEYSDCWVDDARLVVLNALGAAERGAEILTRTECVSLRRRDGLWHAVLRGGGAERQVVARAVANAAGPWVDKVLTGAAGLKSGKKIRLVRGSHIVVPKFYDGPQAYLVQNTDKRVIFINPYEHDYLLIGTTDIPQTGDPDRVAVDPAEIEYLCGVLNRAFQPRSGRRTWSIPLPACGRCSTTTPPTRRPSPATMSSTSTTRPAGRRSCPCSAARSPPSASWPSMRWTACARSFLRWARPGPRRRRCPAGTCPVLTSTAGWRSSAAATTGCLRRCRCITAGSTAPGPMRCWRTPGPWPISAGISAACSTSARRLGCERRNGPRMSRASCGVAPSTGCTCRRRIPPPSPNGWRPNRPRRRGRRGGNG